jgi:hypothetical protein
MLWGGCVVGIWVLKRFSSETFCRNEKNAFMFQVDGIRLSDSALSFPLGPLLITHGTTCALHDLRSSDSSTRRSNEFKVAVSPIRRPGSLI